MGLATTTLWWGHTAEPHFLQLSDFADVGHGHPLRHEVEGLAEALVEHGFGQYGARERVVVFVDHLGKAWLQDGNHRIYVAKRLLAEGAISPDMPVPSIISYRGNADLKPGAWIPPSKRLPL